MKPLSALCACVCARVGGGGLCVDGSALCNTGWMKCHVCCGSPLRLSGGGSVLGSQCSCWGHSALLMQSYWKDLHRSPDPAKSIEQQEAIRSYTLTYSLRDTHDTHSQSLLATVAFRIDHAYTQRDSYTHCFLNIAAFYLLTHTHTHILKDHIYSKILLLVSPAIIFSTSVRNIHIFSCMS